VHKKFNDRIESGGEMISKKPLLTMLVSMFATSAVTAQAQNRTDSADLEEVVVRGIRAADMNAREAERMKDIFSSVISQDDVGNFADQNVAEALQRLPGVTLQKSDGQGEFVNVRGMGAGFVGVTMNNSEMASSAGDGRAVGLNTIPADLMGSIEVFKSLTPDMDLNNIAGKVNVNAITAFTRGRDSLKLTVQGAQHEQFGEFSPKFTLVGTKLLLDDTIGIAVSLSHEERSTEVNQIFADEGLRYIRGSQPAMGPDAEALGSREYMDRHLNGFAVDDVLPGADPYINNPRMLVPNQFEIRQDASERDRNAATLDFGWRPTDSSEYFLRYAYTDYTDTEVTFREFYRYIDRNTETHTHIANVDPDRNFFAVTRGDLQHRLFIQELTDVTTSYALGGENGFADVWTVDYEYSHSESERENPDDRRVQFRIRSLPMYGQLFKDDIRAQIITESQAKQLADMAGVSYPAPIPGTTGLSVDQGYRSGERRQPNLAYDSLFLENGLRNDEINQVLLNLRRDFTNGGILNYVKGGVQIKNRERSRRLDSVNLNTVDYQRACNNDLECLNFANTSIGEGGFETSQPRNPRFDHDFITIADAEQLIAATRIIPQNLAPEQASASNRNDNYDIYEDTFAAYMMAEFKLADNMTLIAGARYAWTEYGSTGWLTLRHDRYLESDEFRRDIAIPLGDPDTGGFAVNDYDGVYPGVHLRYEPRDDMVVRAALWTSFNRPAFGDSTARAEFSDRVVLCREVAEPNRPRCSNHIPDDLGIAAGNHPQDIANLLSLAPYGNDLELGNPDLNAMEATHFDASVSWYGEGGHFFEVGLFYKDITDYIAEVRGLSISRSDLPQAVRQAIDQIDSSGGGTPSLNENVFIIPEDFVFHNVNTYINGDKATVYGAEISYSHFFDNGLFAISNLTLLDSSADAGESIRADETPLPEQADVTANVTLGWENQDFSVRGIVNYRSEVLKSIGTCSQADIDADAQWARVNDVNYTGSDALAGRTGSGVVYAERCQTWMDEFHDDIFSIDLKATYNWRDFKFYLDVLNVTEDVDVFYYRGNEHSGGNVLNFSEGIGRTYQVGVNYSFW
jgi:TonB-dependent receptor